MTYQARPWSAVEAVINAGRNDPASTSAASHDDDCSLANMKAELSFLRSRSAIMLARILSACLPSTKPCVQFITCGENAIASSVALSACKAAATILGRSLLLNARMELDGQESASPSRVPVADAFVAGLYHHQLACSDADLGLMFGRERRILLDGVTNGFRFTAIDSGTPNAGPASAALAPMCNGTILVVQAGRSNQAAIKDAALQITRAGGRIIGSVLDEAPIRLPRWIRGR